MQGENIKPQSRKVDDEDDGDGDIDDDDYDHDIADHDDDTDHDADEADDDDVDVVHPDNNDINDDIADSKARHHYWLNSYRKLDRVIRYFLWTDALFGVWME